MAILLYVHFLSRKRVVNPLFITILVEGGEFPVTILLQVGE